MLGGVALLGTVLIKLLICIYSKSQQKSIPAAMLSGSAFSCVFILGTVSLSQHFIPPLPYRNPLIILSAVQLTTCLVRIYAFLENLLFGFRNCSSILLSPSIVINLLVSDISAHALCVGIGSFYTVYTFCPRNFCQ